jgi:hypothetical protein
MVDLSKYFEKVKSTDGKFAKFAYAYRETPFIYTGNLSEDNSGINCTGTVRMIKLSKSITLTFGTTKSFNCSSIRLTSLKGSPRIVKELFNCEFSGLKTFQYSPEICYILKGNYNEITSLEFCPKSSYIELEGTGNVLKSWDHLPDKCERITVSYHENLPMLRPIFNDNITGYTVTLFVIKHSPRKLEDIVHNISKKYWNTNIQATWNKIGNNISSKQFLWELQSVMVAGGFEGNAKW